jgi:phosphatidylglycerol:prolipoprotein diacylglycerol transferase
MPLGFHIGPIFIRFYGLIIMVGALAGSWLAVRGAKLRDQDPELVWDGLVWVLIGGIIGARLWHIFTPTPSDIAVGLTTKYYLTHPLDALNIRSGGLGIPGAVIGGMLTLYWFCKRRGISFALWVDIAAPGLALGQAIGRWGNFINQELYGPPTDLPWGIFIEPQYRLPGFKEFERFHPLFLYESLWNLMNMGLLLWLGRKYKNRLKTGDLLLVYMIIYPVGRILLEFIRLNSAEIAGINANQAVMMVVVIGAAVWLFTRHRSKGMTEAEGDSQVE